MKITTLLARKKEINVNSNLRKQEIRSDRAVVIKEIPMDMSKDMIIAAVTKFGEIKSIKIQLIGIWQKAVVEFIKSSQADQDQFRALLFTLLVGTTAHNLSTLLNKTVVGFKSEVDLESAFCTVPVFGDCGRFGHSALKYDASDVAVPAPVVFFKRNAPGINHLQLAKLYAKKNVPISCFAVFGGKLWAQVVSLAFSSGRSPFGSGYGLGFSSSGALRLGGGAPSLLFDKSPLVACLASLEHSLELLADQISGILRKLSFFELVLMVPSSGAPSLVGSKLVTSVLNSNMALDGVLALSPSFSSSVKLDAGFNSSSSKVLTTKIGGLESKMSAMEALVSSVLVKLDLLCSDSGFSLPHSS
ncbi:hypothetical protein G9A89_012407 [Geosiphon pyriformis]|nr:hypothetical protein G9A89_012407 [Geosiphon pyriformis]